MKNSKKGISLIVLVITIIVIIILAAAVLLSLSNNNPINNSRQATFDNDVSEAKSAITMYVSNFISKNPVHEGPFNTDDDAKQWIHVVSTLDTDAGESEAIRAASVDGTTTYGNAVTFKELGMGSQPSSIRDLYFNCQTGAVVATPTQTSVTFDYDMNKSDGIVTDVDSGISEGLCSATVLSLKDGKLVWTGRAYNKISKVTGGYSVDLTDSEQASAVEL